MRLAGTLYSLYDRDTHIDRIFQMLDDLAQSWARLISSTGHGWEAGAGFDAVLHPGGLAGRRA